MQTETKKLDSRLFGELKPKSWIQGFLGN